MNLGRREVNDMGDADTLHRDKVSWQIWVVAVSLGLAGLFLVLAAFQAWRVAQVPFLGLFAEPTLIANGSGDQTWAAYAAGIQNHDQLIALDGHPLQDTSALTRLLSRYAPGDVVTLTAVGVDGVWRWLWR